MPVTWCYPTDTGKTFCATGFPVGCLVPENGQAKDTCVMDVSIYIWRPLSLSELTLY